MNSGFTVNLVTHMNYLNSIHKVWGQGIRMCRRSLLLVVFQADFPGVFFKFRNYQLRIILSCATAFSSIVRLCYSHSIFFSLLWNFIFNIWEMTNCNCRIFFTEKCRRIIFIHLFCISSKISDEAVFWFCSQCRHVGQRVWMLLMT